MKNEFYLLSETLDTNILSTTALNGIRASSILAAFIVVMCYISDIHQGITLILFLYTIAVQTAIISYLTRTTLLKMGFGAHRDAIEKYLMSAVFIDGSMFVLFSLLELTGYMPHMKYRYEVMFALGYFTWMVFFPDSHIRKFLKSQLDKHS